MPRGVAYGSVARRERVCTFTFPEELWPMWLAWRTENGLSNNNEALRHFLFQHLASTPEAGITSAARTQAYLEAKRYVMTELHSKLLEVVEQMKQTGFVGEENR